jgi:hypothetical protein
VSKEESKAKKQQEKELFQKYKAAFNNEMNEKSSFANMIFLICGIISLSLIFADIKFFPNYFHVQIINRIGLFLIILAFFILTRIKSLKKFWTIFFTAALGATVFYGMSITAFVENEASMATIAIGTIFFLYFFSNSNTIISSVFVLLSFPFYYILNILLKNDLTNSVFIGTFFNNGIFMVLGMSIHYVSYRLKKREFVARKQLDEKNNQMTGELKIGQAVQQSLLGKLPQKLGKNIFLFLERHPFSEVSGDFYDLVKINDRQYYLFMGDVSGHGVSAALITTMAKSLFNSIVSEKLSTAEICAIFNKKLAGELSDSNYYLTGIVLKIDPESETIEYTNAGHTEPYFYKKTEDKLEKLSTEDPILGMFEASYKSKTIQMKEGDRLLLYTDGLYEAKNSRAEQYMQTFDKDFLELSASAVPNLSRVLFEKAAKWGERKGFNDDVTLLSLEL